MTTEDIMTITERRKYLTKMQSRYRQADQPQRSQLLAEMVTVTGMHRKSLIGLMGQPSLRRTPRRRQRGGRYGAEIRQIVRIVWESLDCICAERLTPQLLVTAQHLAWFGDLTLNAQQRNAAHPDQRSDRHAPARRASPRHSPPALARARAGESRATRRADGTHPVADDDTGIVRGRFGPSQRRKYGRRVCPYLATD